MHTAAPLIPHLYTLVFLLISLINMVLLQCMPFALHTLITCILQVQLKQLLNFVLFSNIGLQMECIDYVCRRPLKKDYGMVMEVFTGFVQI